MNRMKRAVAELGIVIIGVVIALAADSWREGLLEDRIEFDYLSRLQSDLAAGVVILQGEREGYQIVKDAAWAVVEALESEDERPDDERLIRNLIAAAAMGFDRQELASDVTYRELVESGQLNILSDYEVREGIVAYYRQVDRLAENLEDLPGANWTVGSLTGYLPVDILQFGVELTATDRSRLLTALRDEPGISMQLRLLHAQVVFNDREFERLVEQAQRLLVLLEGASTD